MKISIILLFITLINISSSAPALDYTCGDKYCGPSYCENVVSSLPRCQLTNTPIDWADTISKIKCNSKCTQSTNAKCNGATIAAAIAGRTGIKAAYCTDTHLVFQTDGTTGNTPNLDDVNNAPGGTINGVSCVTGMSTLTEEKQQYKIPIDVTELGTASRTNNLAAFPGGGNDVQGGYIVNIKDGTSYGLPVASGTGVTISGQNLFPIFSNVGVHCPQQCEVDRCNNHVGQGGGQPHQHGSGFGTHCLYDANDYESTSSHPPQSGWSLDGYNIYGRQLSTDCPGYSTTLDDCGGHKHGTYGYHYHEQAFDYTTIEPLAKGGTLGETITGTTNGPKYCYKGDISKDALHWSTDKAALEPCCGMSEYYLATGMSWNFDVGTPSCGSKNCPSTRNGGTRTAGSSMAYNLFAILLLGLSLVW